jgi:hypothetical protein
MLVNTQFFHKLNSDLQAPKLTASLKDCCTGPETSPKQASRAPFNHVVSSHVLITGLHVSRFLRQAQEDLQASQVQVKWRQNRHITPPL